MHLDILLRLAAAALAGAALGVERELGRRHNAGLRTHLLVALGACLFTVMGVYGFAGTAGRVVADPTRVAAQVASGIGFIGAGAILRDGLSVRGLTTAATLWVAAAAGAAAGAGMYVAVAEAVVLAIIALVLPRGLRVWRPARVLRRRLRIVVEYEPGKGTLGPLTRALDECGATVRSLKVEDREADADALGEVYPVRRVEMHVRRPQRDEVSRVLRLIRERPEVHAAFADDCY